MSYVGKRLIEAAEEMRSILGGTAPIESYSIHTPQQIAAKRAARLSFSAKIRLSQNLTQQEFASKYNIGLSRLQDWEQGRSKPDSLALAYLTVIEKEAEAVERALKKGYTADTKS